VKEIVCVIAKISIEEGGKIWGEVSGIKPRKIWISRERKEPRNE